MAVLKASARAAALIVAEVAALADVAVEGAVVPVEVPAVVGLAVPEPDELELPGVAAEEVVLLFVVSAGPRKIPLSNG